MRISRVDKETFEGIIREYEKRIFNTVYRLVGNYEDAMDITQTVFLKTYEKLNLYDPAYNFFSWLYRIAVNESINHIKAKKANASIDRELVSARRTPEEQITQHRQADRVQNALDKLNMEYRTVVVLKYFLDLSYQEISSIVGVPVKTVKSRLYTAREQLKDVLVRRARTT